MPYLNGLYKEPGSNFFAPSINQVSQAHDLDFLSKMDSNDPEIYLMNSSGPNDVLHHVVHGMKVRDASNALSRPITIGDVMQPRIPAQESLINFCKRKFGI